MTYSASESRTTSSSTHLICRYSTFAVETVAFNNIRISRPTYERSENRKTSLFAGNTQSGKIPTAQFTDTNQKRVSFRPLGYRERERDS
jgi:hypothetical protein